MTRGLTRFLGLVALVAVVACNDRTREPAIIYEPPVPSDSDMGAPDDMAPIEPDEICDQREDGVRCELSHATGVCAQQRCRFIACESGFDDCDDAVGCETALDEPQSCGSCGTQCAEGEGCRRGEAGYLCTSGIACAVDRYDLDSDPENGCEIGSEWGSAQTLVPPDLRIEAAERDGEGMLFAGSTPEGTRVSTALPPSPVAWGNTPPDPAAAVAIARYPAGLHVLWEDGLSRLSEGAETFAAVACEDLVTDRRHVGLVDGWVATNAEIAAIETDGLTPAFGWGDYLAAFFTQFDPGEVAACAPCHFDPATGAPLAPVECVGARHCRAPGFDDTACATCAPSGAECPDFEIVGLAAANGSVVAVTTRGVVLFAESTLEPLGRAESPDTSAVLGGPRFVGGDAVAIDRDRTLIVLYHSTGFVRGLFADTTDGLTIEPAFPDFAPGIDFEASPHAAAADLIVAVDGAFPRVFRPTVSARSAWMTLASAPGIQGLRPVAVVGGLQISVVYAAAGQIYVRDVVPD